MGNQVNRENIGEQPTEAEKAPLTDNRSSSAVAAEEEERIRQIGANTRVDHDDDDDNDKERRSGTHSYDSDLHASRVVIHTAQHRVNQFSDCWDIEDAQAASPIVVHSELNNTIHLRNRAKSEKQWVSCLGTKLVLQGDYKRWQIKVVALSECAKLSNLVVGIVDIDSVAERDRGQALLSEFWLLPHFGYAFDLGKARKYHFTSKGAAYGKRCKVGDVVTIELNRTHNRFIEHNELRFNINQSAQPIAFNVDNDRNYVLAVAIASDQCALQICD